ncbi:MAG: thioredoxin domain-containing protein [Actinobacteria bacterium]|nr:thioredoxin domain-containing protein [Actinomycetota bacterium]
MDPTGLSPYLAQHVDNPVDWYPWGDRAFEEAKRRDVPIFLSVGYSACHWCHVMAHESFEDDQVAALLNEHFVAVKVDREERPDVDAVYMEAVTALTGHGGWPMSVFLTPDGRPFFGGTYWPKEDRTGMPGFVRVLRSVHEAWRDRRDELAATAGRIAEALAERAAGPAAGAADPTVADRAAPVALRAWDRTLGGFGQAPKFPQAMTLEWLVERHVRLRRDGGETADRWLEPVAHSLDAMARGGIHDHVGGGFHRYSTDGRWLVPHFEKMLYDNALLVAAYAKAAAVTGDPRFDRVARSTADYLLRDLRHDAGGFFSATDADSEGEEGRFFVWSMDELADVVRSVGADPDRFAAFYGASAGGNWEGTNILHEPVDRGRFCAQRGLDLAEFVEELDAVRAALYERREERAHPGLDRKVLTSWNALAVRGLVATGMYLGLPEYVDAAITTAGFLHEALVVDGRLHHVWKDGTVTVPAFLEDVATLAVACLDLYAATGDAMWFERAAHWANDARDRFHDDDDGGFFATAHDVDELYIRPKQTWDNATPSANSVMAEAGLRLAGYTGDAAWRDVTDEVVRLFQGDAERAPTGYGWFLRVAEDVLAGPREVAVVGTPGPRRERLVRELWAGPLPGAVVAVAAPDGDRTAVPLLEGRDEVDGQPAAYVCRDLVCDRPVTEPHELRAKLDTPA